MTTVDYSYVGVGKVSMRVRGAAAPLKEVGNCSSLNFSVEEDTKKLKDFTKGGGGTYNQMNRISSVGVKMTLHDVSPENVSIALFGEVTDIASGSVSDEAHTGYLDGLVVTDYMIDTTQTVTVTAGDSATTRANTTAYSLGDLIKPATPNGYFYKVTTAGTSAGSPPTFGTTLGGTTTDGTAVITCMGKLTLVADTDYTVSAGGVKILEDASFTDGQAVKIDYTKEASAVIEALLNSAQEYELFFDGLNEARSGNPTTVQAFRVKMGASKDLSLIGEDYAAMPFEGEVLKDTTKNGTSVSQYFKAQIKTLTS